jgi:3-hydroxyisobutyrate dehydrogenase-like beta-hydroxyacid dehydrogenase
MGAAVGSAVQGDVLWASEGRSDATALRASAAGFEDVGSIDELVRSCDVILSICPPAAAEEVARGVFDAGFDRIFVEANAISPSRMRRIAELGSRVVDGSIIAARGINLYLAGDGSEQVAKLFPSGDVKPVVLPGKVGAASALKMAFGGWNKIGIALTWQARAIARAYGVEPWLDQEGVSPDRLERVVDRAWRWAPEMDEIAEACESLGLPAGIPRAAADFYRGVEDEAQP